VLRGLRSVSVDGFVVDCGYFGGFLLGREVSVSLSDVVKLCTEIRNYVGESGCNCTLLSAEVKSSSYDIGLAFRQHGSRAYVLYQSGLPIKERTVD
jgi:hypothetical protein